MAYNDQVRIGFFDGLKQKTMDITERLKQRFNVPENWDKHDYEIHRYSFNDLLEVVELVKESNSLPCVSNRISPEEIKEYRKQGRLSGATKDERFYKVIAKLFEQNYDDTDFTILYDC